MSFVCCNFANPLNGILMNWKKLQTSIFLICLLPVVSASAGETGQISGYLRNSATGEPIMYANIVLTGTYLGAASDVHGYYVILNVPAGEYTIKAMMMGYDSFEKTIALSAGEDLRLDMELSIKAIQGEAVEVTAERTRFEEKVEISRMNISMKEIVNTPAMIEADLFRTLQMTPSVTAKNDFSSALIVRGGGSDENLILLDGIEVYNPYHLGGVFSTFNAEAIADAEFLAGGYSAKYGNRNSAVLDITSREGNSRRKLLFNSDNFDLGGLKAEISLLSSKVLAEGPHKRGTWMFAARRTYYDQLAKLYYRSKDGEDPPASYYFWDSHWKVFFDLNERNRLTVAGYYGRDYLYFDYEDEEAGFNLNMDWGNYTTSAQLRSVPSSKFHSLFSVARTVYDWDFGLSFTEIDSSVGKITTNISEKVDLQDWTVKEQLNWFVSNGHTLTTGFEFKILQMDINQEITNIDFLDRSQSPFILSAYLQDKWKVSNLFNVQPGFRISKYELHNKLYFEPRLGFKYLLTENLALKGSWGIYKQYIFTNTSDEEIINFVDFWLPVPKEFGAQSCQHFITGVEQRFANNIFASFEAYYKPYDTMLEVNPNNDPATDEDDYVAGTGKAWGVEILLKKTQGKFSGWLGYSYSRIRKEIDFNSDGKLSKDEGEIYYTHNDIPHSFNAVMSYKLSEKRTVGMTISYSSGQPFTVNEGMVYAGTDFASPIYPYSGLRNIPGEKNAARYPAYFRIDLNYARSFRMFGFDGKFKFQIINATNHFNVLFAQTVPNTNPTKITAFSMFPIIPSFGLEFQL